MQTRGQQVGAVGEQAAHRPDATRNLVLVHEPFVQDRADLEAIAREIHASAPDIEVFVASNDTRSSTTRKQAGRRPTLVYSPTELRSFQPLRGKIYAGALIPKNVQLQRLVEAGVPVPEFAVLNDNIELDPDRFGQVVMVKPTGLTSHGSGIEMMRTSALAGSRWRNHPAVRAAGDDPLIVQRFIDTGEYPSRFQRFAVRCSMPRQLCSQRGRLWQNTANAVSSYPSRRTSSILHARHSMRFQKSRYMGSILSARARQGGYSCLKSIPAETRGRFHRNGPDSCRTN
jgi:hypothetical protein